jgi:hypothetical protein
MSVKFTDYELIAPSQSAQVLGPGTATTKTGDILERLIIVPETTAAGTVSIKDGADAAINVFVAGTLSDLHTINIPIGARSMTGSWQVTTGANVHVIAVGRFT